MINRLAPTRNRWVSLILVVFLVALPAGVTAEEESIFDPAHPSNEATDDTSSSDGSADDSDDPEGGSEDEESIFDPDRPSENETDKSSKSETTEPAQPSSAKSSMFLGPRGFARILYSGRASTDTYWDSDYEDFWEFTNLLTLAARYAIDTDLKVHLEARFAHLTYAQRGPELFERWRGDFDAEIREAWLRWQIDDHWVVKVGQLFTVWGALDLNSPAQLIHPRDVRYGIGTEPGDLMVPVVASQVKWLISDEVALETLILPVFTADRGVFFGNDWAIAHSGSPLTGALGLEKVLSAALDSNSDAILGALGESAEPEAHIENVSLAARFTFSVSGWDLGLGYLFGWEPTPSLKLSPEASNILRALLANPDLLVNPSMGALLSDGAVAAALFAVQDIPIDELFSSAYQRRHAVEVDLTTYLGGIGVRAEAVYNPRETSLVLVREEAGGDGYGGLAAEIASNDYHTLAGGLGLSWESSDTHWVVIVEGTAKHFFGAGDGIELDGSSEPLSESPLLAESGTSVQTALAVNATPIQDWAMQIGGFWDVLHPESFVVTASVRYAVLQGLDVSLSATFFEGPEFAKETTLGGMYDANDNVQLGVDLSF